MHADDLPIDIPQENMRWIELKVRVLVNVNDPILGVIGRRTPWGGVKQYLDAAYTIEQLGQSSSAIGTCPAGHVITKDEAEAEDCGWCQAEAEEWAERRYDR